MANRYWVGGTGTWNTSSTTNWSGTPGGASGASVPTAIDAVIIDGASSSPIITLTGSLTCQSLTTTGATCTFTSTGTLAVSGSITLSSTTTWSATGTITVNATSTITTNGVTINSSISTAVSVTLGSALTLGTTNIFTFTGGTLTLSNFRLSTGRFSSTIGTRVIAFGIGDITTTGSGAVFNVTGNNLTYTGTPTVNINNNSGTAASITTGGGLTWTESKVFNFNITAGSYTLNTGSSTFMKSLNFTGFTGTWTPPSGAYFFGSLTLVSGMNFTAGAGLFAFANSSGVATITSAGKTLNPISVGYFVGGGGTVQLAGNLTLATTRTFTIEQGTLDLNNFALSTGLFDAAVSTSIREIQFGSSGSVTTTGTGAIVSIDGTDLTITGTPTFNVVNNSATAASISTINSSSTSPLNFNITNGTYTLTSTGMSFGSLNFTGFAGTWTENGMNLSGNLTLVPAMTVSGAPFIGLNGSGTQTIASAGKTLGSIDQNGVGTTVQLNGNLTLTGRYSHNQGVLDLAGFALTAGQYWANSGATGIYFGTSNITVTGTGPVIVIITFGALTYTGTPTINVSNNSATAASIQLTGVSASNSFDFNITTGTYVLTYTENSRMRSLNFTGFAGTWTPTNNSSSYAFDGSLTLAPAMTFNASTRNFIFAASSGTHSLTSAGKILNPITKSGAGTLIIADATTVANALTFTAGTLQLPASITTTVGSFVTTGTTLKYLTSSIPGVQATISDSGGTNVTTYLSIQDSNATGGASWSGTDSTNIDAGNNTGWFSILLLNSGNFFLLL